MASSKEVNRTTEHDEEKRGVVGSVMQAVQNTYENARDAVVGRSRDPAADSYTTKTEVVHVDDGVTGGEVRDISADKSRGVYDSAKDSTKGKTMECADYAGEKGKEAKDRTMEKAKEGKDAAMNKMGEYKDYTAEKAKGGKDSATDAAKRAMGYLGDKKEETKQKTAETAEAAKKKTAEAKDKTKEMLSGEDEGVKGQDRGGFGNEYWGRGNEGVIKTEDSRTKAVAEALKTADQMTGQTFNDVGPMDEEGVTRVGFLDMLKTSDSTHNVIDS